MREAISVLIPACAIGICLYPAGLPSTGLRPGKTRRCVVFSLALAFCLGIGFSSVVSTALIVIGVAPSSRAFVLADMAIWAIVAALGWLPDVRVEGSAGRVDLPAASPVPEATAAD